ncbi:MAG: 2-amino-4-hydroxy-6-hydroxymethyldihydropteridine diphosphokinase [Proteobacteria bacterium]|nr:2-amino-4-hydroxy-6-hydroxymethyldihydropteridine diphosphokinase [Pseudomonadota bacterium]
MRHTAWVGLGANLDGPREHVRAALDDLDALPATRLDAASRLYRSAPMGGPPQPEYVNAVARLATALAPQSLLDALLAIESRHGRLRAAPNGPRSLDLDLLLYDAERIDTPALTLPHPRMHVRAFVLVPLLEIDPALEIPGHGPVADVARACADQRVICLE